MTGGPEGAEKRGKTRAGARINVSEVLRRALEEEVRKREVEWAVRVMDEISQRIELDVEAKDLVRKFRDER